MFDKFWKKFKDPFYGQSYEELLETVTKSGKVKVEYINGHIKISVSGVLKSIEINGQKIDVKSKR